MPFLIAQQVHQKLGSFPSNYFKAPPPLPHYTADLIAKPPLRALAAANSFDKDREEEEEEFREKRSPFNSATLLQLSKYVLPLWRLKCCMPHAVAQVREGRERIEHFGA